LQALSAFPGAKQYHICHAIAVLQHIIVPEPDHTKAKLFEICVPVTVGETVRMLAAIDLDDQPRIKANEIDDIRADGMLAAKPETLKFAVPQQLPHRGFAFRWIVAHRTGKPANIMRNMPAQNDPPLVIPPLVLLRLG
jgi:hypothetical protein